MAGMKAPKVKRGSRTTAFSDAQYDAILAVIKNRLPSDDAHRLLAFVELMRWGGLALGDAIHFKLSSMDDKGHVIYTRRKTGRTARFLPLPLPIKTWEQVARIISALPLYLKEL